MYQNLDSQTGFSPTAWVLSVKDYLSGGDNPGGKVFVRSEEWWNECQDKGDDDIDDAVDDDYYYNDDDYYDDDYYYVVDGTIMG